MKRSEMIKLLVNKLYEFQPDVKAWDLFEQADILLEITELNGMLPPQATVTVIPDGKGDFKHSETKREWDKE